MDEPLIVAVIRRYHPEWVPPKDTGRTWIPCLCAFHPDTTKSAAVSFEYNAYRCLACPAKGDAVGLIKQQEEVSYPTAARIAEAMAQGGSGELPPKPRRFSGRRVFSDTGSGVARTDTRGHSPVSPRVRRTTF
jgi:DNA primase